MYYVTITNDFFETHPTFVLGYGGGYGLLYSTNVAG